MFNDNEKIKPLPPRPKFMDIEQYMRLYKLSAICGTIVFVPVLYGAFGMVVANAVWLAAMIFGGLEWIICIKYIVPVVMGLSVIEIILSWKNRWAAFEKKIEEQRLRRLRMINEINLAYDDLEKEYTVLINWYKYAKLVQTAKEQQLFIDSEIKN